MKVLVADEAHIFKLPDNTYWSDAINGYSFYTRYMDVFDEVRLVGKLKDVKELPGKCIRLDGPNLEIFGIPYFQGPKQFLPKIFKINSALKGVSDGCDVAIMRMPSVTSMMVWKNLKANIPLGGEIIYDPYNDVHDKKSGLIMRLIWSIIALFLRRFCLKAKGVSYVTENAIQEHFPSYARLNGESKSFFESFYSSIILNDNAFVQNSKKYENNKTAVITMSDVAMNNERKGERVVIHVVAEARKRGYNVSAIIIGDGSKRREYEELCQELQIKDYVEFTGLFPSADEVREVMKNADLFVFPTKAEGLPRGVLEAMAIGLPVLSTPVGGIPEVLESKYLFDPTDVEAFTNKLCDLLDNPDELTEMSTKNLKKAMEYRNDNLQKRRNDFYSKLAKLVQ